MSQPSIRPDQHLRRDSNLPLQLTPFVGRAAELVQVRARLEQRRLVTLTGTGGVGKTRLAIEVAKRLVDDFEDGVWLIELASLADARLVPPAVAATLGVRASGQLSLEQALVSTLRSREVLLVLDNCEHLVEPCARLIDALLRACPRLRVLATSRQPLRIDGEWTWRVPALPVPEINGTARAGDVLEYPSVRLFVDRASAVAGFLLTDDVAPAVARVCQRLEGIPLALELAAARVAAMGVADLAERLDDALRLLVDGSRTAPARHQTLQGTIEWSYALLSDEEQHVLDRLSVFAGGFDCEAAEAVVSADERVNVVSALGHLVDRSLVIGEAGRDGTLRYRLLEVVRQYGQHRLRQRGELADVQHRHVAYCLDLVRRAVARVLRGDRDRWQDRLQVDLDNFRAARAYLVAQQDAQAALTLNAYLFLLLAYRGFATEGRAALREALALPGGTPAIRGRALHCLALLAYVQADYAAAAEFGAASLAFRRGLGNPSELAWSLLERGTTAAAQADFDTAMELLDEARASSLLGGSRYVLAYSQALIAYVESLRGNLPQARACARKALELAEAHNFLAPTSHALSTLGELSAIEGDSASATRYLQTALERASAPNEVYLVARPMLGLALLAIDQRDDVRARELLVESLGVARRLGNPHRVAQTLERVALFCARSGSAGESPRFLAAAAAIRAAIAAPMTPLEQRQLDEQLKQVPEARKGSEPWTLDEACERALALLEGALSVASAASLDPRARLTPRELEVAELVARGLSNREIANSLTIAERTASSHLEHVLNKLGFHSRSQIATWVTLQRRDA